MIDLPEYLQLVTNNAGTPIDRQHPERSAAYLEMQKDITLLAALEVLKSTDPEQYTLTLKNGSTIRYSWQSEDPYAIDTWPYKDLDSRFARGDSSWREVSERIYWDQCEVVFPAAMKSNCFAVGEPYTSNANGPIHTMYVELHDRFFARHANLNTFSPTKYKAEILRQFAGSLPNDPTKQEA